MNQEDHDERTSIIHALHGLMQSWGNNQLYFESRAVVFRAWRFLTTEQKASSSIGTLGQVKVPARFLSEFIKAVNFHSGHGTPSMDRVQAIVLTGEAEALLLSTSANSTSPSATRRTAPLGMRVCEPACHSAAACLTPDNCKADMTWENKRGRPDDPCEALCRECKADGMCIKNNPFYRDFAKSVAP